MNELSRIFDLLRIYTSFYLKSEYCNYYPVRLWIELSSRCNLKCRFCYNRKLPPAQKGDMDLGLYRKIIDEARGRVHDVNLFHRGEPLLNKDAVPMIAYASSRGVKTRIHTNATLLNKKLDREIIAAGLDMISFSFDGYTGEVYEKNRAGAKFEKTLGNIIDFLQIKKQLKSKKPYTAIQVMQDENELRSGNIKEQKRIFLNNFKNLPLDRIVTRVPHNWGGLIEIDGADKRNEIAINEGKASCTFPWYSLTIFFNGNVFLCPQDFEGKICLGDANKETIGEIFNGEAIRKMRKVFKSGVIDNVIPCRECDRIGRKSFLGVPLEYLGAFIREHLNN